MSVFWPFLPSMQSACACYITTCGLYGCTEYVHIIIKLINYNWVDTRWQWLFYMYTKYEISYY